MAALENTIRQQLRQQQDNIAMIERMVANQNRTEAKENNPLIQAKHFTPWKMESMKGRNSKIIARK